MGRRPPVRGRRIAEATVGIAVHVLVLFACSRPAAAAQTIDFDALPAGMPVSTIDDATFGHSDPGVSLVVATGRATTSAPNYLGAEATSGPVGDPQKLLLPGDRVVLQFASPTPTLDLRVVSTAGTPPDAFALVTANGTVTSGATPTIDASGDEIWQLSIGSPQPFTSAELQAIAGDEVFAFHVDDVVVPEPVETSALGVGVVWSLALSTRRGCGRRGA